jgi:Zn-dependent protease
MIALIIALTVHEASHALVAFWLGDTNDKNKKRISLNPLAHLDPLGTLMLFFVGMGWGKPVMIDAEKLKPNFKVGMALVAAAGPLSNFLLAAIFAIIVRLKIFPLVADIRIPLPFMPSGYQAVYFGFGPLLQWLVWLNLGLAIFNLIPINPLDGSRLWQVILPTQWYLRIARVELLGLGLILGIFLSDVFLGTGFLAPLLAPMLAAWQLFTGMNSPSL